MNTTDQKVTYAVWKISPTGIGSSRLNSVSAKASPSGLSSGNIPILSRDDRFVPIKDYLVEMYQISQTAAAGAEQPLVF